MKRFGLILSVLMCSSAFSAEGDLAEHQTRFVNVTEGVRILAQGSAQWVDAHIDLPLETGDLVHVDEDNRAEISISKNALLILDGETDIVMGHTTPTEGQITLSQGALLGKIESDPISGNTWIFSTPYGVCTVKGTEFALVHSLEQGTHLGVFKGVVQIQPAETAEGMPPSVLVSVHEEGVLEKRKPFKRLKAYSPLMKAHFPQAHVLQKRFPEVADVWVPMTPEYRLLLRRKYIAEVHPHKAPPKKVRVQKRSTPH